MFSVVSNNINYLIFELIIWYSIITYVKIDKKKLFILFIERNNSFICYMYMVLFFKYIATYGLIYSLMGTGPVATIWNVQDLSTPVQGYL